MSKSLSFKRITSFVMAFFFVFSLVSPILTLADDTGEVLPEATNEPPQEEMSSGKPIITKFYIEKDEEEKELPAFYLIVPEDAEHEDIEFPESVIGYVNNTDEAVSVPVKDWNETDQSFNEDYEGENKVVFIPEFENDSYTVANGIHMPYGIVEYKVEMVKEEDVRETETPEPSTEPSEEPVVTPEPSAPATEEPTETEAPTAEPTNEPTQEPIQTETPTETETPAEDETVKYTDLIEAEASNKEPLLQTNALSEMTMELLDAEEDEITSPSIHTLHPFPDTVVVDDVKIERFTVRWLSKSTGSSQAAKFDRLELVGSDENTVGNQQFQIDFALSALHPYAPGTIEMVIPAYLWLDRDGNEPGELTLSVPAEGEGNANFAWKRIGDNIVITNTKRLNASSIVMLQGTFRNVDPSKMVDIDVVDTENNLYLGISKEFYVTLNVESTEGNIATVESNGIDASINTESHLDKITKTAYDKTSKRYVVWYDLPEELPASFVPDNADDYVYVRWYVSGRISGSQEVTMYVEETNGDVMGTKILGIQTSEYGDIIAADSTYIKSAIFDGFSLTSKSAYVWMAYPKSAFNPDDYVTIENTVNVSVVGKDDEIEYEMSESATALIKIPITYTIQKVWEDNNDEKGHRPAGAIFHIYDDKENPDHYFTLIATEDSDWKVSWSDEGQKNEYRVIEYYGAGAPYAMIGNYETYYDSDGQYHTRYWSYHNIQNLYDANSHTWTIVNEYTEGSAAYPVSCFLKWNTDFKYSRTDLTYTGEKTLSYLYNGKDAVVPFNFTSQINFFTPKKHNLTPTAIVEDGRIELNDVALTGDDYEFAYIYFTSINAWKYQDAVDEENYYIRENCVETSPLRIYGYINNEWVLIGTVTGTSVGAETATAIDGAEWKVVSYTNNNNETEYTYTLYFPANVEKIKYEITSEISDMMYIVGRIAVRLKLSDRIRSWIDADFEKSIYTMMKMTNYASQLIENIDNETGEAFVSTLPDYHEDSATVWLHGRSVKVAATLDKEFYYMDNDLSNRRLKFRAQLTLNQQSTIDELATYKASLSAGEIPDSKSGIYYDLLPYLVEPDLESVKVIGGHLKNAYVIEDYKGTGRTLLVAIVEHENRITMMTEEAIDLEHRTGEYPSNGYRNQHIVYFDCYYSWDSAMDYGVEDMYNYAAYEADEAILANFPGYSGEPNDPRAGNNITSASFDEENAELMSGLGEGKTTNSFVYGSRILDTSEIDFSALTSLQKHISLSGTGLWLQGLNESIDVQTGSYYTYRVYTQSATDTETSNIIIFDSLENYVPTENDEDYGDTQWHGEFVSLDVREIEIMGVNPVIYYSTVDNLDISTYNQGGSAQSHLQNDMFNGQHVWSTTMPANPADVKAIAIDATKDVNGNDFVLEPNQILTAYIRMKAPQGDAAVLAFNGTDGEDPTLNGHAYNGLWMSSSQNTLGSTKNELSHFEYTKLGIYSNNLYIVKEWDDADNNDGYRPQSVTIRLFKDGMDTGETLVLDENNEWSGVFENLLKFNDDRIPYIYTIDEDPVENYTTKIIQSGNHFTVKNTHELDQVTIAVIKEWVGDEEFKKEVRPNYISYTVYADGEATEQKYTLASNGSNVWTGSFSANKYNQQQEVDYSVVEDIVTLYETDYYKDEDGLHIVNTFYPYGNLSLYKETMDTTTVSENQGFKISVELLDADGDELIDKYYYDTSNGRTGYVGNGDTLTIYGGEDIIIYDLPHNARYSLVEESLPGWTMVSATGMNGIIKWNTTKEAYLLNRYSTKGYAQIQTNKVLTGSTLKKYQFQFYLYDESNNLIAAAANDANGIAYFSNRTYTGPDNEQVFKYKVTENNMGKLGYDYDSAVYYVVVVPHDNGRGSMNCDVTYLKPDDASAQSFEFNGETILVAEINVEEVLFNNKYAAEGFLSLRAWKDITGGKLVDNQFNFKLAAVEHNGICYLNSLNHLPYTAETSTTDSDNYAPFEADGHNLSDGSVVFETSFDNNRLKFTEEDVGKTYIFAIREVDDGHEDVTYDTTVFGYAVTVFDNGDGTLSFSTVPVKPVMETNVCETCQGTGLVGEDVCTDCNGVGTIVTIVDWTTEDAEIPVFHNQYKDGALSISKLVSGEGGDPNQEFTFHVKLIGDYDIDELEYILSAYDYTKHSLTIHYGYYYTNKLTGTTEWSSLANDYKQKYSEGDEYSVESPEISGYELVSDDNAVITGTMGAENVEIYVEYQTAKLSVKESGATAPLNGYGYPMHLNMNLDLNKLKGSVMFDSLNIQPEDGATIEQSGTSGGCTWELYSDGTLIVRPTDGISGILAANASALGVPWYYNRTQIIQAKIMPGVISNSQYNQWFYGCTNMIKCDVSNLTLQSNISNMRTDDMFKGCRSLTSLDLSNFDTSKVFVMNTMFANCTSLEELNLSGNFSTEEVNYMSGIFSGCTNLSKIVLGEHFKFKGRNITSSTYQALLPTPPSGITTRKWIREDEIYGPYTSEQLKTTYDTNPELYQGIWIWQTIPTEYKIIFSTEDPDVVGSMPIQKIVATEDGIVDANAFRKIGYNFIGWHDETNNRDWLLGENTEITIPANTYAAGNTVTFSPVFEKIDTHVTIVDGEFTFTLHAGESATFPNLPAGITYQVTEDLPKGWTLVEQSNSSGTIQPLQTAEAEFTNTYTPDIVQVNLVGTKLFGGKASTLIFNFTLELTSVDTGDENVDAVLTRDDEYQDVSNNSSGMITFNPLVFETPGIYQYKITEIARGKETEILFDSHEELITIVVSEDESGALIANVTYDEDGIVFRNYYAPGSLTISKIGEGLTEANKLTDFHIRIKFYNENGTPLQDGILNYTVTGSGNEEAREGEYLLYIRYFDEEYHEVAEAHKEWLTEGSEYSVDSPILPGMTTQTANVSGTIGQQNVYVNVMYKHDGHKLTIKYVYEGADGNVEIADRYVGWFNEGDSYSVESPVLDSWETETLVVEGTMEDSNIEVIVSYIRTSGYLLTIEYGYYEYVYIPRIGYMEQWTVLQRYSMWYNEGEEYNVPNPEINGFSTKEKAVSGIMGEKDITITVVYNQN